MEVEKRVAAQGPPTHGSYRRQTRAHPLPDPQEAGADAVIKHPPHEPPAQPPESRQSSLQLELEHAG
jgi:hypothetical protein